MDGIRKNDQRDFEEQLIFGITLLLLNITVWSFSYNQFTVFYLFGPWLNVYFSWRGIWDCLLSKQFNGASQRHKHTNIESPYKAFKVNISPRILKFAQTWLFARLFAYLIIFLHFPWFWTMYWRASLCVVADVALVPARFLSNRSSLFNDITDISKIQLVVYHQWCVLIGWATTRLYVIAH